MESCNQLKSFITGLLPFVLHFGRLTQWYEESITQGVTWAQLYPDMFVEGEGLI